MKASGWGDRAMNADDEKAQPVRYTYKPSVAGSPQAFELGEQGLSFQAGFRSGLWRYEDIVRIRLTYRPVSMLAHRFRADLQQRDGKRLTIISASWAGLVALTPQNDGYRAFIEELHRRVDAAGHEVACVGGLHALPFLMAVVIYASVMLALAALLVRALFTGEYVGAAFMVVFAIWSGWHVGSWLKRNKPQRYQAKDVPRELLP